MAVERHRGPERIVGLIGRVLEAATGGQPPPPESLRAVMLWDRAVDSRLAAHSRAVRLREGRLFVEVSRPVWKQELLISRRRIINEMNRLLGERLVADIVFTVRGLPDD
jgi:hypothetical protein